MLKICLKFLLIPLSLVLAGVAHAQLAAVKVTDSIQVITGQGGNIGVFMGDDGTFMIDDKFPHMSQELMDVLAAIGAENPRFLINTHYHGDHTGGNENFGKAGSTIVAHHNVRKRLASGGTISAFNANIPPAPEGALPVLTYELDMTFHINGDHVRAIHVPAAHTDGDSFVMFEVANVLHTGDLFFNGFYPFIDVENGGSVQGVIDAASAMLELSNSDTVIIPGHGPLATPADLENYRDMLMVVQERLGERKAKGMTAQEAAVSDPLADLEEKWGDGRFTGEQWIKIIYDGI